MKPTTSTATPQGSPAPAQPSNAKSGATASKQPRKAAAAPLSDVTNLLPETPTPTRPRRSGRRPLSPPSEASSACSSSASVTPAPKPSSAAVLEEEHSVVQSPTITTVYARRGATEAQGKRRNPTNNKVKAPVAAASGAASCPNLEKLHGATTGRSLWLGIPGPFLLPLLVMTLKRSAPLQAHPSYQKTLSRSREHTLQISTPLNCQRKRSQKPIWSEN